MESVPHCSSWLQPSFLGATQPQDPLGQLGEGALPSPALCGYEDVSHRLKLFHLMSRESLSQQFNLQSSGVSLCWWTPRCREGLFDHTTSLFWLTEKQTLGAILPISSGSSATEPAQAGISSAFPAERLDFLAWHSHAPLPAPSCTFGCGP